LFQNRLFINDGQILIPFQFKGERELVTAPLDGTILPGVTRNCVIDLAKSWGITVSEKRYTMNQVLKALNEGRILEAFGCGTACIIAPISAINFKGVVSIFRLLLTSFVFHLLIYCFSGICHSFGPRTKLQSRRIGSQAF
jgi:branched-subunit amino acid aminotransferase/4-amino-4-deoxychorismate lyase